MTARHEIAFRQDTFIDNMGGEVTGIVAFCDCGGAYWCGEEPTLDELIVASDGLEHYEDDPAAPSHPHGANPVQSLIAAFEEYDVAQPWLWKD